MALALEVVGQERAIKSLLTKLSSPFPQHILLYGPLEWEDHCGELALKYAKEKNYTSSGKMPL